MRIDRLTKEVYKLRRRIIDLERLVDKLIKPTNINFNPNNIEKILLSLPNKLRLTMSSLIEIKEGTATDICKITKHARAYESNNLNQLVRMNLIKKRKGDIHKRRIFYL